MSDEVVVTTHVEEEIGNDESEKLVIIKGHVYNIAENEGPRRSNRRRPFSKW